MHGFKATETELININRVYGPSNRAHGVGSTACTGFGIACDVPVGAIAKLGS